VLLEADSKGVSLIATDLECFAKVWLEARVEESGRIVLPDGMSYRMLLLPDDSRMTPPVLQAIASLVKAGATVAGPRPMKSPSLTNQPDADAEVAKIAAEVWGDCDGKNITSHAYGRGRVVWGEPVEKILKDLKTPPDFRSEPADGFAFIHRRIGDTDAYFVSNQKMEPVSARLTFRAGDRALRSGGVGIRGLPQKRGRGRSAQNFRARRRGSPRLATDSRSHAVRWKVDPERHRPGPLHRNHRIRKNAPGRHHEIAGFKRTVRPLAAPVSAQMGSAGKSRTRQAHLMDNAPG
jgi:hypothetical protein